MKNIFYINDNWQFTLHPDESITELEKKTVKILKRWHNAVVPGTIHTDLIENNLIADPFYSDNEERLQWIGDSDWIYKTTFNLPQNLDTSKKIELVFEGLDTVAKILLNGKELTTSENMFRKYSFDVTNKLIAKKNVLQVEFTSNVKHAKRLETEYGKLPVALRSERVYVRKAQYSFGWDWGPAFITMGIWKNVYLLQSDDVLIENISFSTKSVRKDFAEVQVKAGLSEESSHKIKIIIEREDDRIEKEFQLKNENKFEAQIKVQNPKLWWPNGMGEPDLYNFVFQLINDDDEVIDEVNRKVGIRTVELKLEENNQPQFQFVINGKPVFAKGANWIPADTFLPRIKEDKYKRLLQFAKEANMNIVRVWGGGIYEDDKFYETCDELGLMVWQDFMFACAAYPEHREFIDNVTEEIKQNVNRLRHHPSIVIWCGNNENEWIWFQEQKKSYREMPGYKIYHEVIMQILSELDSSRPYWPSSPFGFDDDPNSEQSGNRHQWQIWSMWKDYSSVAEDKSLFVTEFGFQSPANTSTFKSVLPKDERIIQSRIFEFHNKQVEGPERLIRFLSAHLPVKTDFEDFIYLTQLNHGFAMKECLEHWRFNFPKTNGSIIWQLNDCWPVSSWALIDSDMKPKLPYYFVKQSFASQACRFVRNKNEIGIELINSETNRFEGSLKIDIILLPEGKTKTIFNEAVNLNADSITVEESLPLDEAILAGEAIYISSLYDKDKNLLHRNFYKTHEWKHLKLPEAKVKTDLKKNEIRITTDKPAFFVSIQLDKNTLGTNGMIILKGESVSLPVNTKKEKIISIDWLNRYCN
ncbi:MAG: glycoside hydrolase family 2 protein [Ignavibacteriales bacterium]|nr:MAG: glycoside hydrolase family 2 protein [Ignavibacteriales bacterium]